MKKFITLFIMIAFLMVSCNSKDSKDSKSSNDSSNTKETKDTKESKDTYNVYNSNDPISTKLDAIEQALIDGDIERAEWLMDKFEDEIDDDFEPTPSQERQIDRIKEKYERVLEEQTNTIVNAKLDAIEQALMDGDIERAEWLMDKFEDEIDDDFEPTPAQERQIDRIEQKYERATGSR